MPLRSNKVIILLPIFRNFLSVGLFLGGVWGYGGIAAIAQSTANPPVESDQSTLTSQRYRRVFFPNGMPILDDPFSGTPRKALYAFYGESDLRPFEALLYSQEVPGDAGHDASYTVHLALLAVSANRWEVLQNLDITGYIPVQTEFPGNLFKMDGQLNSFVLEKEIQGLHVNLWAMLSGTGSTSGASDLFYIVDPSKRLRLVLSLNGTSRYTRMGMEEVRIENSKILVGDIDRDGTAAIVVESTKSTVSHEQTQSTPKTAVVYKYVHGTYQRQETLSAESVEKLGSLSVLPRSKLIPTASGTH